MPHETTISYKTPRLARISGAVFFFISGFGYAAWASRIPYIQRHLQLNEAQLGAVLFAMPAGLMLTIPLTNYLLSRLSSRKMMILGAILFNFTLALSVWSNSKQRMPVSLPVAIHCKPMINWHWRSCHYIAR